MEYLGKRGKRYKWPKTQRVNPLKFDLRFDCKNEIVWGEKKKKHKFFLKFFFNKEWASETHVAERINENKCLLS